MYHIQEFAALTGLSADTLRYYEKEGCLRPRAMLTATAFIVSATLPGWLSSCG